MTQYVWIWNPVKFRWHNGRHIVTQEVIDEYPFRTLQEILYGITGVVACKDSFKHPIPKIHIDWVPLTPKELIQILDKL